MKEYKVTMTWQVDDSFSETDFKRLEYHIKKLNFNLADWTWIKGISNMSVSNIDTVWVLDEKKQ